MNECYVYFAFIGEDFDPDDITKELGISPTSILRKGSRIPNKIPKTDRWILSTKKVTEKTDGDVVDVYELAQEVVNKLKSNVNKINEIKNKYDTVTVLEVVIWITMNEKISTPMMGFDTDVIDFLAQTRTSIDVDIYRN